MRHEYSLSRTVKPQVDSKHDGVLSRRQKGARWVGLQGQLMQKTNSKLQHQCLVYTFGNVCVSGGGYWTLCAAPLCCATLLVFLQRWVAESSATRIWPSRAHMAKVESPLWGRNLALWARTNFTVRNFENQWDLSELEMKWARKLNQPTLTCLTRKRRNGF